MYIHIYIYVCDLPIAVRVRGWNITSASIATAVAVFECSAHHCIGDNDDDVAFSVVFALRQFDLKPNIFIFGVAPGPQKRVGTLRYAPAAYTLRSDRGPCQRIERMEKKKKKKTTEILMFYLFRTAAAAEALYATTSGSCLIC